jgi:hypothetical protein
MLSLTKLLLAIDRAGHAEASQDRAFQSLWPGADPKQVVVNEEPLEDE